MNKEKKNMFYVILLVVVLAFATIAIYLLFLRGSFSLVQLSNKELPSGKYVGKSQDYSFEVPDSLSVKEEACTGDDNCVAIFSARRKDAVNDLLLDATIEILKDYTKINLSGQTMSTSFKDGKWIYSYGYGDSMVDTELEPITISANSSKEVYTTTTGGSSGGWTYYIYRSESSSEAVLLMIPQSNRVRCDLRDTATEQLECEEKLKELGISPEGETWIEGYPTLNSDMLLLLDSFGWGK